MSETEIEEKQVDGKESVSCVQIRVSSYRSREVKRNKITRVPSFKKTVLQISSDLHENIRVL
jgi:hypothetical protein